MTVRHVEMPKLTDEQRRVARAGEALHRDGASPAGALELLAAIVEDRTWERLVDAKGRSLEGRFRDFVEARAPYGLGYDPDQLPKVLALRHPREAVPDVAYRMATMREAVRTLLLEEIAPALPVGRPNERATFIVGRSDTAEKITARLKRDDPELAERVVTGEVTPHAAALTKGWRKPRIVVSSPESVATALRRHMTTDQIARLIALLMQEGDQ